MVLDETTSAALGRTFMEPRLMETLRTLHEYGPEPVDGKALNGIVDLYALGLVDLISGPTSGEKWTITEAGANVVKASQEGTVVLVLDKRQVEELRDLLKYGGWGQLPPSLSEVLESLESQASEVDHG